MTTGADSGILKKLEELEKKEGTLPQGLEFYQKLLRVQSRFEPRIGVIKPNLSNETISERIDSGSPLVGFDELVLDWSLLQDIFTEVTGTFAQYPELFGSAPGSLMESQPSLLEETAKAWFEGTSLPVADDASRYLLEAIIHATLKPVLVSHSKALLGLVNQERWRRAYCPICGGSPDFAFLDKERAARWLLCSRCDTEWLFQRLECPFCGTQNQDALAYFTDNGGLYRLYVCEQCKGYLKAIDLRQADSDVLVSWERLITSALDTQAQEKGYSPRAKVSIKMAR